ncbi:hypothetical protein MUK42_00183 [Musa troglodytarum]|uniref:Uncharacterized protein n=1 Tax=Musa troglodytarum TaxID=320322 RepID=A0A9E7FAL3_9LILI|nr:hypothetical protein MUK42_00183 [Musa troglodytarum]
MPLPAKTLSEISARMALTVRRATLEPAMTAMTTPVVPSTLPNGGHSISLTSSATPPHRSADDDDVSFFLASIISLSSSATDAAAVEAAVSLFSTSSSCSCSFFLPLSASDSSRVSEAPPFSWTEKRRVPGRRRGEGSRSGEDWAGSGRR